MTERTHAATPTPETTARRPSAKSAHVLVVDDQQIVREYLAEVLQLHGHRVTLAAGGAEAFEAARRDPPHVLLTDLRMSGMDGQDLMKRLHETDGSIVSVVITGYGTVQHAVDLMREGAFDVLTKPCPAPEIVATVARAYEHHVALRTNAELDRKSVV